jgi:hypothetical protein
MPKSKSISRVMRYLTAALFTAAISSCAKPNRFDPTEAMPGSTGSQPDTGANGGSVTPIGGPGQPGTSSQATDGPMGSSPGGSPGVFTCSAGSPCQLPGKPCIVGATACQGAAATCTETPMFQANGSPCGGDSVCLDGQCSPCKQGLDCPLPDKPCKAGAIECGSGKPQCAESGNAPNGTSCGAAMVCKDGACAACQAGDSCIPANPCHQGTLDCAGGNATCKDAGTPKSAGSQCGSNKVCGSAGECVACTAGAACELPDDPCKTGKIDCASGAPKCLASGGAANGKGCGNGRVCRMGSCEACSDGMSCTPDNKCHTGILSCMSGSPVCKDGGTTLSNGTMCGTNQFCNNGNCVSCTPGNSCSPGNACKTGKTSCDTGTSRCEEQGDQKDGTGCGSGRVCQGGSCVACGGIGQPCCGGTCNGATHCSADGNVVAPSCDNGMCRDKVMDDCDPCEQCQGTSCKRVSGGEGQPCCNGGCSGTGLACLAGQCQRLSGNGSGCSTGNQCQSGQCQDGVCCNRACNGPCEQCGGGTCKSSCKSNETCRGNTCEPDCTPGASCTGNPNPACFGGKTACSGGTSQCVDDTGKPKCGKFGCSAANHKCRICDPSGPTVCNSGNRELECSADGTAQTIVRPVSSCNNRGCLEGTSPPVCCGLLGQPCCPQCAEGVCDSSGTNRCQVQ